MRCARRCRRLRERLDSWRSPTAPAAQGQAAGPEPVRRVRPPHGSASSRMTCWCSPTCSIASGSRPARRVRRDRGAPEAARRSARAVPAHQGRAAARRDRARDADPRSRVRRARPAPPRHGRGRARSVCPPKRGPGPGRTSCIDEVRKLVRAGEPSRRSRKPRAVPPAAGAIVVVVEGSLAGLRATSSPTSRTSSTRS